MNMPTELSHSCLYRLCDFFYISVVGARDEYGALLRLSSGDVCLYGKTKDDKYDRPIEWIDNSKFIVGKEVNQSIGIGTDIYYWSYKCFADSDGGMVLVLSPNLELNLTEGKFNFKVESSIEELCHDARFLLKLKNADSFSIQGHDFPFKDPIVKDDFEKHLRYLVDLYETLSMLGFKTNVKISELTEEECRQITKVVNMRLGAYNNRLNDDVCRYDWKYDGKIVPLLVIKLPDKNILESAIYSEKYAVFLPNEKGEAIVGKNKVPLFICHNEDVLSNLLIYNYDIFRKQIDDCDCNDNTCNALLA